MLEAMTAALALIVNPTFFAFLILGVSLGIVIGMIPGMGGIVGMSIILPFIFGMDQMPGLALLIGASAVTATGDTFPAVLIGVPGTAGSQATIMDGYPLARQGRAKEALGAAFTASVIGGVFGAVVLIAIISVVRPLLLSMASPQLFMLTILGLSLVGVLSRKAPILGVISALFGAFLGLVGVSALDGAARYTLGTTYLTDGISLTVLAVGLFGLPEIINLLAKESSVATKSELSGSAWTGLRATLRHPWLVLRSAAIGVSVGAVPGLGGAVVDWLIYGIAQESYKDNENFGSGDIRGVIAPESGNNAKEGGAFLPTLVFGIPGSGVMAVLIGGLLLLGVQVGPQMLESDLPITIAIAWTLALANVIGAAACFMFIRPIARLTTVRPTLLMPFIIVLATMAAFQSSQRIADLVGLLIFGIIGWTMNHIGMPRPPMLIGVVLSASSERYLHLTRGLYGWEWLLDPIVIALGLAIFALTVIMPVRRSLTARAAGADDRFDDESGGAREETDAGSGSGRPNDVP